MIPLGRGIALAALLASAAGCRPALSPLGIEFTDLSGVWRYQAREVTSGPLTCTIDGITLTIVQVHEGGDFTGGATPGEMKCSDGAESHTIPLQSYPVSSGYTFEAFVAFSIYTDEWRNSGHVITPDSLEGTFKLVNGATEYTGRFTAVREPR